MIVKKLNYLKFYLAINFYKEYEKIKKTFLEYYITLNGARSLSWGSWLWLTKKEPDIQKSGARGSQIKENASAKVGTWVVCLKDKENFNKYKLGWTRGQIERIKIET